MVQELQSWLPLPSLASIVGDAKEIIMMARDLDLYPRNRKLDRRHALGLGEDIAKNGQTSAVVAYQTKDMKRPSVFVGQHRTVGLQKLNMPIRVLLIERELAHGQIGLFQLLDNDTAKKLTILDRFELYSELIKENNWTRTQLAEAIGKTPGQVSKVLTLGNKCSEAEIALLGQGNVRERSLFFLASHVKSENERKPYLADLVAGKLTCESLEQKFRDAKSRKAKKKAAPIKISLPGGTTLLLPRNIEETKFSGDISILEAANKRREKFGLELDTLPSLIKKGESHTA
jgi:hypothetical protein